MDLDLKFEWHEAEANTNIKKHGISFEFAKRVFDDVFAVELADDRGNYGERRLAMIGMVEGLVLYVVFIERNDAIRLISARRASVHEQRTYIEAT